MARDILRENLKAEMAAFTFPAEKGVKGGNRVIKEVPFVYYPNFISKVADMVNDHERQVKSLQCSAFNVCPIGLLDLRGMVVLFLMDQGGRGQGTWEFQVQHPACKYLETQLHEVHCTALCLQCWRQHHQSPYRTGHVQGTHDRGTGDENQV